MRHGVFLPTKEHGPLTDLTARIGQLAASGLSSVWMPQSSGFDAITALAVIGQSVPDVEFGTAVVPTYPRHPVALAAHVLTASAATNGRFTLGIGLSHKMAIEGSYGMSYEKPARHMDEYLSILLPLLDKRAVDFTGETLTGRSMLSLECETPPQVLLAALQPRMLRLAGGRADGTITWCTGPKTVEAQIVPTITKAAADAGRPDPRVIVALPTIVTEDEADGRVKAGEQLGGYENIPVYRAVLDREGVQGPADISIVGDEASCNAQLDRLADLGATDFMALPTGTPEERQRTIDFLAARNG